MNLTLPEKAALTTRARLGMLQQRHRRDREDAPMTRPIIAGFHPDPSMCRVGTDYYLVTSSFEYAPGVPLFRSADLRSWEQVGHVLARPSQLDVSAAPGSGGITAPSLRFHDGRFWLVTTNLADGGWQTLVHTEDPLG